MTRLSGRLQRAEAAAAAAGQDVCPGCGISFTAPTVYESNIIFEIDGPPTVPSPRCKTCGRREVEVVTLDLRTVDR